MSSMLVAEATAALKLRLRGRERRRIEQGRVSHEVLVRDAIWSADSTHLGRDALGAEIAGEVIVDRASLSTVSLSVGGPSTEESLLEDLRRAALERGGWPLVLQTDNARIYLSALIRAELEARRVLLLRSRARTPTDNPAVENRNRELKEETGLGRGVVMKGPEDAAARLSPAIRRLDDHRLRPSRGWKTAAELDRDLPRADACVDRETFYATACSATERAVLGLTRARDVRRAEQEAVWSTLENQGLARRHVGRRALLGTARPPAAAIENG
jgi:transposase InsO family protein